MTIWDLEERILNSIPLSAADMRVVQGALRANAASERILACEATLRLGDERQRLAAVKVLSQVVQGANSGEYDLTPELVMAFFHLPPAILERPDFRATLESASSHADESVRVNCMVALVPLIKAGGKWAEDLLKAGLADVSEGVRQNARVGLSFGTNARRGQ